MTLLTHRDEGPESALAFMREIGAALSPDTPSDPERMRDIYARHAGRLLT
jgi:hypothetical protein